MAAHAVISFFYIAFSAPAELIALRFVEGVSLAAVRPAVNAYIADAVPPSIAPRPTARSARRSTPGCSWVR